MNIDKHVQIEKESIRDMVPIIKRKKRLQEIHKWRKGIETCIFNQLYYYILENISLF